MSTITGTGSGPAGGTSYVDGGSGGVEPPLAGAGTTPAPTIVPPPLFSGSFTGQQTAVALGLSSPRGNFGDLDALISEIAGTLKDVGAVVRDNDLFARSSSRLTGSSSAASPLMQMLQMSNQIAANEHNIREKTHRIEVIDQELAPLYQQRTEIQGRLDSANAHVSGLEGQVTTLNGQITTLSNQITTLDQEIAALNTQIAATPVDQRGPLIAQRDQKVQERADKIGERTQKISDRDYKNNVELPAARSVRDGIQGELDAVNAVIEPLEAERAQAEASIAASVSSIGSLIVGMTTLALDALVYAFLAMLNIRSEGDTTHLELSDFNDSFEQKLGEILQAASRLRTAVVEFDFMAIAAQRGLGNPSQEQGDRIAARFGAVPPAQAQALGFAAALTMVTSALQALMNAELQQSAQQMSMQGIDRFRLAI